jgi:type II secretory pathway pseudopilin PulG
VGYRGVSQQDIRQALAARLQSWKQATERSSALQVALQQRRAAFERLQEQFGEWQSRRDLLAQRLETLKIRQQTQTLSADSDTAVFDDADLARATELADAVDRDLRIAEARAAIGLDPLDVITELPSSEENEAVESEVDRILNGAG